jgi:hypothetical protein
MTEQEQEAYRYMVTEWEDKLNFIRPIHLYPSAFPTLTLSREECVELIRHAQIRKYNIRRTLGAGSWDVHPSKELPEVQKAVKLALQINRDTFQYQLDEDNYEVLIHKFQSGMGFCYHTDIGPYRPYCKLGVSVQLNDPSEYKGGELSFFEVGDFVGNDTNTKRQLGSVSVFPAFLPHKVNIVPSGDRHSMIIFFYGERFR